MGIIRRQAGELHGWKEISDYLKISARTAIKYADIHGLPVRTILGRIIAYTEDLDQWRQKMIVPRKSS